MTTLKLDVTYFTRTPGFSPVQGVHSWNMSVTWVNRAMIMMMLVIQVMMAIILAFCCHDNDNSGE